MNYQFFTSYARNDDDVYLQRFFEDLELEVRLLTPGNLENVGFRDTTNIKIGEEWSPKLAEALQSCNVLVSLFSPTYFTRPYDKIRIV